MLSTAASSSDAYAPSNDNDPVTTKVWEAVLQEQARVEKQRRRMVRWRQKKKKAVVSMLEERQHLEKKLQRRLAQARFATDRVAPRTLNEAFLLSSIELASFTRENMVLQEAIDQHVKWEIMLQKVTQEMLTPIQPLLPAPTSKVKLRAKAKEPQQLQGDDLGWRVRFPNGEPFFYFNPFTREEYDDILRHNDVTYAQHHPCTATVGEIFGWTVDYVPLARSAGETAFVAHARFTRRICCTLDKAQQILPRLDKNLWPVLVTPRSWGRVQSGSVHCQVLQNFGKNAHVMVCNIPGKVNLRYLALARHFRERNSDGQRVDKYIITIADSEANARNREAEGPQRDVQWIREGGTYISITEVDEDTVDVVFDQSALCLSEMHGRELYVDWVRFPIGLEQFVSSVRLLKV